MRSQTMRVLALLLAGAVAAGAADGEGKPGGAYVGRSEVSAATKKTPTDHYDRVLRMVEARDYRVGVAVIRRPRDFQDCAWVRLDNVTEVMRVLEGSGTFVTGGTLAGEQPVEAGDPDAKLMGTGAVGTAIEGGETRRLAPGDIVIIPAGVPHGFLKIDTPAVRLELVRIDTGKVLALK